MTQPGTSFTVRMLRAVLLLVSAHLLGMAAAPPADPWDGRAAEQARAEKARREADAVLRMQVDSRGFLVGDPPP
jgi:hypothetical protein